MLGMNGLAGVQFEFGWSPQSSRQSPEQSPSMATEPPQCTTKVFRTWRQRVKLVDDIKRLGLKDRASCRKWKISRSNLQKWRLKIATVRLDRGAPSIRSIKSVVQIFE
jgi:hypothetical protein